jgi:outer membrane protein assembly factor BamB
VKRVLVALVVLVLIAAAGGLLALRWYRNEQNAPLPEKRGSPTVEFRPTEPPAPPRPKKFVRNEPWPLYGYNAARTRDAVDLRHRPPYRGVWSFRSGNVIEFPPIVVYDRVIFTQQRGRLFAVRAQDGKIAWRKHFRHCAAASPAGGGSVVYVALMQPYPCRRSPRSQPGLIAAIQVRGGKLLWQYRTGAVESSPLLHGGVLYFGSWDHHVYALDVRRRKPRLLWRFEADDEVNSSPAFAGGRIYFGTDGGRLYALNAKTGRPAWRSESYSRVGRREYFYATPAVAYGRVYIGNTDGNVYAFGAGSGRLLWASNAGSYVYTAAAVSGRTVYVGSYDGNVYAFDAATGVRRWRRNLGASIHGAPAVISGIVYFATCGTCGQRGSRYAASGKRATYGLDARTGRVLWRFPVGHYSPIVADQDRIYVVGSTRVYALEDRSRARPAKKSKPATTRKANGQSK